MVGISIYFNPHLRDALCLPNRTLIYVAPDHRITHEIIQEPKNRSDSLFYDHTLRPKNTRVSSLTATDVFKSWAQSC